MPDAIKATSICVPISFNAYFIVCTLFQVLKRKSQVNKETDIAILRGGFSYYTGWTGGNTPLRNRGLNKIDLYFFITV